MTRIPVSFRCCILPAALMVALLGAAPSTHAAIRYSLPVTGSWTAPETWQSGTAPADDLTTDQAVITNGAVVTVDAARAAGSCIVGAGGGTGILHIASDFTLGSSAALNTVRFYVGGAFGSGVADQATGTVVQVAGRMSIGPDPGLTGAYTVPTNATLAVAGGLWIGNNSGGALGNGALILDGGTLTVNPASPAGLLVCGGSLTVNGGTLTTPVALDVGGLNNPNVPRFTLNGGRVTVGGQFVVGAHGSSSGTQSGGALQVNGTFFVGGHNDNVTAGTGTYTQASGDVTVTAVVHFNGGGKNAGIYNLDGGTLTTRQIVKVGTGAGTFNFNGGTLRAGASGALLAGLTAANVRIGGARIDSDAYAVTVAQPLLAGAPSGGLTKTGTGTLALTSNTSTYTGDVHVVQGTLEAGAAGLPLNPVNSALGNPMTAGRRIVVGNGGTLLFTQHDQLGNAASLPNVQVVVEAGGNVVSRDRLTTFGPVLLNGGTLTADGGVHLNAASFGSFDLNTNVTVTGDVTSTLVSLRNADAVFKLSNLGARMTTFDVAAGAAATNLLVAGILGNNWNVQVAGVIKTGAGAMVLAGTNTYTGDTRIYGGRLKLAVPPALQTAVLDWNNYGGALDLSALTNAVLGGLKGAQALMLPSGFALSLGNTTASYAGVLGGTNATVTKVGNGTQVLSGGGTWTGVTTVNGGVLQLGKQSPSAAQSWATPVIRVNAGGVLQFVSHDNFGNATGFPTTALVVSNGTVTSTDFFNPLGPLTLSGGTLMSDGGHFMWGTYWLKAPVTVTGHAPSTLAATARANARVDLLPAPGTVFNVEDVTGDGAADLTAAVVLANPAASVGALAKEGPGTLRLTGANTYGGTTVVDGGTLLVDGVHTGGGAYTVVAGSLGGSGSIPGAVTVTGAGTLAPGGTNGVATLTVNSSVTFIDAGILDITIQAEGADRLALTGALSLNGARLRVTALAGTTLVDGTVYPIVTGYSNPSPGAFAGLPEGAVVPVGTAGCTLRYDTANRQITLTAGRAPGTVLIVR